MSVMKLLKGTKITVERYLGETVLPFLNQIGERRFIVEQDIWVEAEQYKNRYIAIYQAREFLEGKRLQRIRKEIISFPRMRRILMLQGRKSVEIVSKDPILYSGEVAIMDYVLEGCKYFILTEQELKQLEEENLNLKPEKIVESLKQAGADMLAGEFLKFTFVWKDGEEFSVVYPLCVRDLLHHGESSIAKVVFEGDEAQGIKFLSGWTAGHLNPIHHKRIKLVQTENGANAYLMPNKNWADEIKFHSNWQEMFDEKSQDGIKRNVCKECSRIIVNSYDINGNVMKERIVYYTHNQTAFKEILKR